MMALSRVDREEFLAEPRIGVLGVAAGGDRAPLLVPIWYAYEPGGEVWIVTPAESRKAGAVAAAGRFSMLSERSEPSIRYASVEGPVVEHRPATDEEHVRMVRRYLPEDKVEGYLEMAKSFGEIQLISMRPERWLSADLGSL